jgi:mannosyltransferase
VVALIAAIAGVFHSQPTLDEAYVYALSQHGPIAMLERWADEPQALISQVVVYPIAAVAHPVEWMRLPALILFLVSVVALWWAVRTRYSAKVALGAAALLAISPLAVGYASDARWPTYVMLAAILSWGCLLRAIDTGRRLWWVLYGVALLAGIYTNTAMVLIVVSQIVPVLWARRRALVPWVVSLVAVGVVTIPLAVLTARSSDQNFLFRIPKPGVGDVPGFFAQIIGGSGPERARQLAVLLAVILVLAAAWTLRDRLFGEDARGGWLALSWVLIPIAVAFVLSQGSNSVWEARYLLYTVPGVCLLIAWSASRAPRPAAMALVAGLVVLMLVGVVDVERSEGEPSADWTAALVAARPPGAPVVFYESEGVQGAGYHSALFRSTNGTPIIPDWDETPVPKDIVLLDARQLHRLPAGPPGAALVQRLAAESPSGVVVLAIRPSDPEGEGIAWARAHCTVTRQDFDRSPTAVFRVDGCTSDSARSGE